VPRPVWAPLRRSPNRLYPHESNPPAHVDRRLGGVDGSLKIPILMLSVVCPSGRVGAPNGHDPFRDERGRLIGWIGMALDVAVPHKEGWPT
jgi:hypothetical protein